MIQSVVAAVSKTWPTFVWRGILALILALALAYTIALWVIAAGVLEILAAVQVRDVVPSAWLWALAGIVSIAAVVLIAYAPGRGLIPLSYTVGVYATLAGIASIAFAFRLRGLPSEVGQPVASCRAGA
jgi:uncharacterized membrane protein HdeD (DUF308 family)